MPAPAPLFDPNSREAIRSETHRPYVIAFAATALLIAGLIGGLHYEELPFLAYLFSYCPPEAGDSACVYPSALDWLAGVLSLAVIGPLLGWILRARRILPTLACRACEGRGWILDLEATNGRCPRCGHDRFRYGALEAAGVPVIRIWRSDDIEGEALLELRRKQKLL